MDKKGQVEGVQGFIMTIIGISVILAVGLITLTSIGDSEVTTANTVSTTNESITYTNNTWLAFGKTHCLDTSVSNVWNETNHTVDLLTDGNVSITVQDSSLLIVDNSEGNGARVAATVLVDYSCVPPSASRNATQSNISNISGIPTWIGILIVVSLAFIVLGYFYKKQ